MRAKNKTKVYDLYGNCVCYCNGICALKNSKRGDRHCELVDSDMNKCPRYRRITQTDELIIDGLEESILEDTG